MREAVDVIADAVRADDFGYERTSLADFHAELRGNGVSINVADMMAEVGEAVNSRHMRMEQPRTARTTTPTSIERFIEEEFAPRCRAGNGLKALAAGTAPIWRPAVAGPSGRTATSRTAPASGRRSMANRRTRGTGWSPDHVRALDQNWWWTAHPAAH